MTNPTLHERLLALLRDPAKLALFRVRGRHAVGDTPHNACAATASQVLLELGLLKHVETLAEGLSDRMKQTRLFEGTNKLDSARAGDLVVCADRNGNGRSDHVWWIVEVLGDGWYRCFDNQSEHGLTHRRRLDGHDKRTPARGLLRLKDGL